MKRRVLSILLVLVMLVGILPVQTFAATSLTFSGGTIDVEDKAVGPYTIKSLSIYKQSDYKQVPTIVSATQDGTTIDIVLAGDTDPSYDLQAGFSGTAQSGAMLLHSGNKCVLSGGSGTMTYSVSVRMGPQLVGSAAYTINFTVQTGESCSVSLPSGEGYTVTGGETAYKGSSYSFTVSVAEGYTGENMVVKANGSPLTLSDGKYTISEVTEDVTITVEGVAKREACTVSLPTGEGYTVSGETSVYKGDSYSFTVSIAEGYTGENMVVKANGSPLTVSGGKYTVSSVTENLTITVEGVAKREACTVSLPTGEGYTVSGETSVYKGDSYSFTVSVAEGYTGENMVVKANGSLLTVSGGKYTVSSVTENLTITVAGVEKKETHSVSLPSGEGYTVTGETTAYKNESYTFTVTVKKGYTGEDMVVKANGSPLSLTDGKYTVSKVTEDLTITVEGVESTGVTPTTIYSGKNKPSSFGYVSSIVVDDVQVEEYIWVGDHAYVTLISRTADDATALIDFTTGGNSLTMTDTYVTLADGKADRAFTAKASIFGTWNFTIHLSNEGFAPTLASGISGIAEEAIYTGDTYTLDLAPLFSDIFDKTLSYSVKVDNGAYTPITGTTYSITSATAGTKVLTFKANNGTLDSTDTYVVTLTVEDLSYKTVTVKVPETLTPSFYTTGSFGSDGVDVPGTSLTAAKGQTADGLIAYMIQVESLAETITVRADGWGGMAVQAEDGAVVTMRPVQTGLTDLNDEVLEGTVTVAYGDKKAAVGTEGKYLLAVGQEYGYTSAPTDTDYQIVTEKAVLEAGLTTQAVTLKLGINNAVTIIATTGAKAQLYNVDTSKYYYATEYEPKTVVDNGDGTTTHYFSANGSSLVYRVSMDGKITKMGYFGWNQKSVNLVYDADDKSDSYRLDDYSGTGSANSGFTEDSVLLNINSQNNLQLSVGQTKTLKAYRAWEIIKVSYQNYILTPDFTYTILSGKDVVSLTEKESPSTADGDWMTLTALKEGVAVIEVTYDAMEVAGGQYDGIYGASDPARTGLVVVQVGGSDKSVDFGIDCFASIGKSGSANISYNPDNERAWDAEFDTLYFTGSSGELSLSPTAGSAIKQVAVSNNKGASWTVLTGSNGTYTAKILAGNNIIRVTTASGTAYQVVRGDKVTVKFTEVADKSDGDGIVEAGETIRVFLMGLHTPIPKMAGNYNPGFGGNTDGYSGQHLNYTSNGTAIYGPGSQYNFITASNYVEITMPSDGSKVTLTDGYIGVGIIGLTAFTTGGDSHRNIPDAGCGTRGSTTTYHTRSILPQVTVFAGDASAPNSAPIVRSDAVTEGSIYADQNYAINPDTLFQDLDGNQLTFTVSVDGGTPAAAAVDYKFTPGKVGTYVLTFTASDGKETAQHSVTVTVTERPQEDDDKDETFGLTGDQIAGYVTVSFQDYGVRVTGETGLKYPVPLGSIVAPTKVPFVQGENMAQVTKRLLDYLGMGCSYSGSLTSGFYLGAISNFEVGGTPYGSMGEFDAGTGSGWMVTLNGWFINAGASEFVVKNGDVITWKYTCQLGKDIGDTSYYKSVADVIGLIDEIGTVNLDSAEAIGAAREAYEKLTAAEKKRVSNYDTLTAAEAALEKLQKEANEAAAKEVKDLIDKLVIGSVGFEETVKKAKEAYDALTDAQKKLVTNYGKLADALKELATEEDREAAEAVEKLINAIGTVTEESQEKIEEARKAYEELTDEQKALVNNLAVLEAAEEKLQQLQAGALGKHIYKTTGDYLEALGTPSVGAVGGEWMVIGLARSDRKIPDGYYDNVLAFARENIDENERLHSAKSTENARLILALTALGKDVTNVDGHNLLMGLNDMAYVQKQGINGPIWALLAFDSGNYPTPSGDVSRETLIQMILDKQLPDGGWALTGEDADPDMTGMAIQALAPYYGDDHVKMAIDWALETLSRMQNADGSFSSVDGKNAESIAQVIVALTALGIDPDTDSRFVKNGTSAFDALCSFYVEGGGFRHLMDGKLDGMATEQGYYALAAYYRLLSDKNSLYDMTDVINMGGNIQVQEPAAEATEPETTEDKDTATAPVKTKGGKTGVLILVLIVVLLLVILIILLVKLNKRKA